MKEKYIIDKQNHKWHTFYVSNVQGYCFHPKNTLDYGFKIEVVTIFKFNLIKQIIQKKVRNKLNLFIEYLINKLDNEDADDSRKALGEIQRYRMIVNSKYKFYLDEKYLELLNNKFDVIENELKANIIYNHIEEEEIHRSR